MTDPIQAALQEGRRERAEGRYGNAERAYARAAQLARSSRDQRSLAHALRHLSDFARERGEVRNAREHASKAVALYRGLEDALGLANAIRLQALSTVDAEEAKGRWQEARELYSALNVTEGVAECDRHLDP